jgi:hypothetical protein
MCPVTPRGPGTGTVAGVAIGPMVPLTTAANPFAARILAAHLGAEGIVWELRGNVDGPYPVGPVEVLVSQDDLAVAREVVSEQLVSDPVPGHDATAGGATGRGATDGTASPATSERSPRELWVLLAVVLLLAAVLFGRLLSLGWH